jgi:hypothetical protein
LRRPDLVVLDVLGYGRAFPGRARPAVQGMTRDADA